MAIKAPERNYPASQLRTSSSRAIILISTVISCADDTKKHLDAERDYDGIDDDSGRAEQHISNDLFGGNFVVA